jgi:hypothetical protein
MKEIYFGQNIYVWSNKKTIIWQVGWI